MRDLKRNVVGRLQLQVLKLESMATKVKAFRKISDAAGLSIMIIRACGSHEASFFSNQMPEQSQVINTSCGQVFCLRKKRAHYIKFKINFRKQGNFFRKIKINIFQSSVCLVFLFFFTENAIFVRSFKNASLFLTQ